MTRRSVTVWLRCVCRVLWVPTVITATVLAAAHPPPIERFIEASSTDQRSAKAALEDLGATWKNSYTAMIIDMARMMRPPRRVIEAPAESALTFDDERSGTDTDRSSTTITEPLDHGSPVRRRLIAFLERQTKQSFGQDLNRWREWMWKLPYDPHPDYAV